MLLILKNFIRTFSILESPLINGIHLNLNGLEGYVSLALPGLPSALIVAHRKEKKIIIACHVTV